MNEITKQKNNTCMYVYVYYIHPLSHEYYIKFNLIKKEEMPQFLFCVISFAVAMGAMISESVLIIKNPFGFTRRFALHTNSVDNIFYILYICTYVVFISRFSHECIYYILVMFCE